MVHSHLGQESGERARESWGLWVRTVSGYPRFWAETQATACPVSRAKPSTWKGALTPASTPVQTWRWGPAGPVTCPPALEEARSKPGPAARPSLSGPFLPWALNGLRGECSRRTRRTTGEAESLGRVPPGREWFRRGGVVRVTHTAWAAPAPCPRPGTESPTCRVRRSRKAPATLTLPEPVTENTRTSQKPGERGTQAGFPAGRAG